MMNYKIGDVIHNEDRFAAEAVLYALANKGITAEIIGGTIIEICDVPRASMSIQQMAELTAETFCDNFCMYRFTANEDYECDWIRTGRKCPCDLLL